MPDPDLTTTDDVLLLAVTESRETIRRQVDVMKRLAASWHPAPCPPGPKLPPLRDESRITRWRRGVRRDKRTKRKP